MVKFKAGRRMASPAYYQIKGREVIWFSKTSAGEFRKILTTLKSDLGSTKTQRQVIKASKRQ